MLVPAAFTVKPDVSANRDGVGRRVIYVSFSCSIIILSVLNTYNEIPKLVITFQFLFNIYCALTHI